MHTWSMGYVSCVLFNAVPNLTERHDSNQVIFTKYERAVAQQHIYFSQGSAATDVRGGGSFHSCFLCRLFRNLTVKVTKTGLHLPQLT